ncbi:hypothetical protein HKBW3S06_01186, partial [Candidatus Hakubella thermalkaliphila]
KFDLKMLSKNPRQKSALLINPPVYDTQYWAEWSQPYGILRIGALLKKHHYKRIELFDFMETDETGKVHRHKINPEESYEERDNPTKPIRPYEITKNGEVLELYKYHFGKTWPEFGAWLQEQGLTAKNPPDEIYISAIMSYWWESARDLILRLRRRFGQKSTIILGGIYPTLVPEHAAEHTAADIVVAGEVEEANGLWTDLSFYRRAPQYAIVTPSRGCPFSCAYCASKTLNGGKQVVRYRPVDDIIAEMKYKYETYGIRDFAFYADFLLWRFEENFMKVLERIVREKLPFRLYAPEGLDVSLLSRSQKLVDLLKRANFQKIYLPCESIDDQLLRSMDRRHVRLEHLVRAAKMCEKAGFRLRNLEVNSFLLYGLPGEKIGHVVKTIIFVSEIVGSIIPMLFTPVPSTAIYNRYFSYFQKQGWDRDLHMLNGKLYPFLKMNEGSISDYVDLQRLMFMLNSHYRSKSFQLFGDTLVSTSFRENLNNGFSAVVDKYKQIGFLKPTEVLKDKEATTPEEET